MLVHGVLWPSAVGNTEADRPSYHSHHERGGEHGDSGGGDGGGGGAGDYQLTSWA